MSAPGRLAIGIHVIRAFIALGLLGQLGQVNSIFVTHFDEWTGIYAIKVSNWSTDEAG
jgi:hypothetical protein